ncbi:protein CC2D2B isoform X5 [Bubalus bubalis]|uniref:protein CC2D2B isoform X5 n=1 Tax=Bubalus bubalis TaxID=89462 RepID=UPI001D10DF1C|nr:protein CC2D2B isoform X5 [Bubalus bubalis]
MKKISKRKEDIFRKMSEDTDNIAVEENVDKHLPKDLNIEENRNIIETLRGKVREKLKNAKINQGEKSSTQLLIDNKVYQWSKAEVPLDEGLSFFILSGEEDSAIGQSAEQNFAEGQDEDFVEEVIFPDLLEVKAADYEDDQEQIKKPQANIFVPSSSPVINQLKLPEDMMPRILEEEGFYIQKKPEIYKKTCNKMENRLLKLEEGKCWFEESGEIMSLPSPIRRSWNFRLNISKEPLNPALTTMYRKLKALMDATKLANENSEISQLTRKSLQDYYRQISDTKQLYELEKEKDFSLLHSILRTWKQIKSLRQRQGFTSTSVKLQFQRLKMNKCDEQKQELSKMPGTEKKTEGKAFKNRKKQEVYEISKRACLLAKLYLPLPNSTELKSKTILEYLEFSSDKLVIPAYGEVGSNVPFLLEENGTEELCLLTSGKLSYSLSWALDENGAPPPAVPQSRSAFCSVLRNVDARGVPETPWLINAQKLFEWANEVRIDPNNPECSDLMEFIMYIKHKGQDIPKYFRLEQLQDEFNFVSEEEMKKSKRFQLLQLRNAGQLDVFLLQQMPLYDREIPDLVFQEYESQIEKDMSISDVNSITAQRINSANFLKKDTVHPFVEVSFQHTVYQTSVASGSHPCWNEEIKVDFILPGHDCNFSSLSKIKDNIYINIFDEMIIEKHEDRCFKSCSGHSYIRKNWLGSIVFPFSALLQQSEISGTFQVNIPPVLLGYTWSKTYVSPKEDYNGQNLKECTFLNIFATIEPQISYAICSPELDKFSDQIDILERARIFTKNCKALFPKRRITTTVFNDEGIQILVIRYIKALNPPQQLLDMFLHDSNARLDLVAHFVSLIPIMPEALDENDGFDIWMTSEGHVAYVLTQETDEYLLWNPLTGRCYKQFDPFCPLQGVDCLFDGENVWFNLQQNNSPMAVYFDYSKESFWKQLLPKNYQGTNTQSIQPEEIIYSDTNKSMVEDLKNRIERTLKCKIMEWRPKQPTRWNRQCTLILRQILPKLELGTGSFVSSEEESEFERLLQFYWVTGFPIQMPYTDVQSVIDAVYQTGIHSSEFPQTEFALAVYIHPYPNNILSVWVYLASLARHQ